jgi:hypothetical protein
MRHFHRTHITPDEALTIADEFFPTIGLERKSGGERQRVFVGALGTLELSVRAEGGHYTLLDAVTDQTGESRLDRSVKRYFARVHRAANPAHRLRAAY